LDQTLGGANEKPWVVSCHCSPSGDDRRQLGGFLLGSFAAAMLG
jgi:hypothetical protein